MSLYNNEKLKKPTESDPVHIRLNTMADASHQLVQAIELIYTSIPKKNKQLNMHRIFENPYTTFLKAHEASQFIDHHSNPLLEAEQSKINLNGPVVASSSQEYLSEITEPTTDAVEDELQAMIKDETAKYTSDQNLQAMLENSRQAISAAAKTTGASNEYLTQNTDNN